jgi:hypothetical protein
MTTEPEGQKRSPIVRGAVSVRQTRQATQARILLAGDSPVLRLEQASSRILLLRNKEVLVQMISARASGNGTAGCYRRNAVQRGQISVDFSRFSGCDEIASCVPKPNGLNEPGGEVDGR